MLCVDWRPGGCVMLCDAVDWRPGGCVMLCVAWGLCDAVCRLEAWGLCDAV